MSCFYTLINVQLLGFKENPYPYIKEADLFVCASIHESYCLVVAESLVVGTPVVSTMCIRDSFCKSIFFNKFIPAIFGNTNNLVENIIGEGPEEDIIKEKISELDMKDNVQLLGFKENPYPWNGPKNSSTCSLL